METEHKHSLMTLAMSDDTINALSRCRTLDDVFTLDMSQWQQLHIKRYGDSMPSIVAGIHRAVFYAGAGATLGLTEYNGVSMIAISAMIDIETEKHRTDQEGCAQKS